MALRKIVKIDEDKCNGCGLCIPNCAEGALKIVDGKVKLISEVYCDGLGACLGNCPLDAITIEEREAEEFDEEAVEKHLKKQADPACGCSGGNHESQKPQVNGGQGHQPHFGGCPGSRAMQFNKAKENGMDNGETSVKASSQLTQWPVQLMLVSPNAPYFKQSDLLITADCVPFAYGNYHSDYLKGKSLVVGCPKLDDIDFYIKKLEDMIRINDFESITVLRMEVPCCGGMSHAAKAARDNSGVSIPIKVVTIGIEGEVIKKEYI